MTSSKLLTGTLVAASLVLSACSTESRKKQDVLQGKGSEFRSDSGTNFYVTGIQQASPAIPFLNAYGMTTRKQYNLKACMVDANGSAVTPDVSFRISGGKQESLTLVTDRGGCVSWKETHSFPLLADETYFRFVRVFTPVSIYRGAVYAEYAFNPWADALVDLRTSTLPDNAPVVDIGSVGMQSGRWTAQNRPNLKINVDTIGFDFRGLNLKAYEIRPDLGLTVAHDYEVRLKPTVIRKVIASAGKVESFVGGRMKVYFALFRENRGAPDAYDVKNLISASEFILSDLNNSGSFIGDVTLKFKDISDLSSRTAVLVSLVPIDDEIEGLKEMNFMGVMKPGRVSTLSLRPSPTYSAREATEQAILSESRKERVRPLPTFLAETGFKAVDEKWAAETEVFDHLPFRTTTPLQVLTEYRDGKQQALGWPVLLPFCEPLFAGDAKKLKACKNKPWNHVAYGRVEFLEDVLSAPNQVGITTVEKMTMNMSISKSTSDTTSTTTRLSFSAGASLSAGLDLFKGNLGTLPGGKPGEGASYTSGFQLASAGIGGSIKVGVGADYGIAREWRDSDTQSNTVSVSSALDVNSEGNTFQFAAKTRRCAIVAEKISDDPTRAITSPVRGLVLCEKSAVERQLTESYYLLGQNIGVGGSPFSDPEANTNSSWRMFVRGRDNVQLLYGLMRNANLKLVVDQMASSDALLSQSKSSMMGSFPGMRFLRD